MSVIVRSWFLGRIDYSHALKLQESLVTLNCRPENKCPAHTILMLEHNPVYTVGVRSDFYPREHQEELQRHGAQFIKTNRGGLITYHGPGQLVAYPIVNLRGSGMAGRGLKWFIDALEQSGYELCCKFGGNTFSKGSVLFPELTAATGVWLDKHNKIMSIGIHRTGNVTHHGIGLNCTIDPLEWFDKITPCGLSNCKMTSLESTIGTRITPAEVAPELSKLLFANLFNHQGSLECTYSSLTREDASLPWGEVARRILTDAEHRTKASQAAEVAPHHICNI